MYQAYQDDIIDRDSPAATDTPVRILAVLHDTQLLISASAWSYVTCKFRLAHLHELANRTHDAFCQFSESDCAVGSGLVPCHNLSNPCVVARPLEADNIC
jgi:hypothetical protein